MKKAPPHLFWLIVALLPVSLVACSTASPGNTSMPQGISKTQFWEPPTVTAVNGAQFNPGIIVNFVATSPCSPVPWTPTSANVSQGDSTAFSPTGTLCARQVATLEASSGSHPSDSCELLINNGNWLVVNTDNETACTYDGNGTSGTFTYLPYAGSVGSGKRVFWRSR